MGLASCSLIWFLWVLRCILVANGQGGIGGKGGLELHFYKERFPEAELMVEQAVGRYALLDASTPAAAIRLAFFHDCQVKGCDGSVLLENNDATTAGRLSAKNFGIRKIDVANDIKSSLEQICPSTVSCADIIQLAAREAIHLAWFCCRGPLIKRGDR